MAISAVMAAFPNTVNPNVATRVRCSVYNAGPTTVTLRSVTPVVTPTGQNTRACSHSRGVPVVADPFPNTVAGGGGFLNVDWDMVFHAPLGPNTGPMNDPLTYDVGAIVETTGGLMAYASVTQVTVQAAADGVPTFPSIGQLRFDYLLDSYLLPVVMTGGH